MANPNPLPVKRGPGRPRGARNKESDAFLIQLRAAAKSLRGRPDFDLLKEVVEQYYYIKRQADGIIDEVVARKFGFDPDDPEATPDMVARYYEAMAAKELALRRMLFEYLKTFLDYSFPKMKAIELTGKDGGPIEVDHTNVAAKFDAIVSSDAERVISDAVLVDEETSNEGDDDGF